MLTILFDGVAYGMLLFVLACGLAVTLGLMNFINLAHGAFAMAGGYVTAMLMNRSGVPFLATLPLAFLVPAAARLAARAHALPPALWPHSSRSGAVFDRPRLHGGGGRRLHDGLAAAAHPAAVLAAGPRRHSRRPGRALSQLHHRGLRRPRRRAAAHPHRTRFGSRLRAAVDDPRVARGLGINVGAIFASDLRRRLRARRPWAARSARRSSGSIRPFR